ncbi:MAG: hypothetical protein IPI84_00005 [Holophagaceae bacterium]|nr:hypothetical protein [Holophagaceae bacterium]
MTHLQSTSVIAVLGLLIGVGCMQPQVEPAHQDIYETLGRRKPTVTTPLFALSEEVRRSIPAEKLGLFIRAQRDIDLIVSGQEPVFCTLGGVWLDGGTKSYSCSDYVITYWKEIRQINGVDCTRKGVSIKFNTAFLGMNRPFDDVSHTWIEFSGQRH